MNNKLESLKKAVARAQDELLEYEKFLETRNNNSNFISARAAYENGWRIEGWTWCLTDTDDEISIWNAITKQHFYFADGVSRDTDSALIEIGITDEQAEMLSDFCEELGEELD